MLNSRPARSIQNNDSNTAIGQILLVFQISVSRNQNLETMIFSFLQELPVLKVSPSQFMRS